MTNIKYIENAIRSSKNFEELKDSLIELIDFLPKEFDFVSKNESELLSERVSNIEYCLEDNRKKINIDRLRL